MFSKRPLTPCAAMGICMSGALLACSDAGGPGDVDPGGMGHVVVQVAAVPAIVSLVTATVGTSTFTLTPDPSSDQATGAIDAPEGSTEVLVQAYNSSSALLYMGRDTVTVIADSAVVADVQLVCVSVECDGIGGGTGTLGIYSFFPSMEIESNNLTASCNTPNYLVNGADPNQNNYTWMANGAVSTVDDADYYCIPYIWAGDTITVQTYSSSLGSDISSLDPFVALVTPSLTFAASDDNSGAGAESGLSFIATESGTWYVIVTTANAPTGAAPPRYTVRVRDLW